MVNTYELWLIVERPEPAPWATPKAGDATETGGTEKQQEGLIGPKDFEDRQMSKVIRQCALCGVKDRITEEQDAIAMNKARIICTDGRDLDYVCAECDALLPPSPLKPAPWQTPKWGDGSESGSTEKQQAGWPSIGREAQRVIDVLRAR